MFSSGACRRKKFASFDHSDRRPSALLRSTLVSDTSTYGELAKKAAAVRSKSWYVARISTHRLGFTTYSALAVFAFV